MLRLSIAGIHDSRITMFDIKEQRIVEVKIVDDNGTLQCLSCKSDECLHVGFAFGVMELREETIQDDYDE